MSIRFIRKSKSVEQIKRETLQQNAKEQFRRIASFGVGFPVIASKI